VVVRPHRPSAVACSNRVPNDPYARLPDVRDGLTRIERVILYELHKAKEHYGDRHVPSALLYGRVVEHVNISVDEFQRVLARLVGK
jgi:hypothetical protein